MPINFTDVRPTFVGSETYVCPNECLITLRKLTDKLTFTPSKGGSIASGGEVPLTVILPKVDTLKIVDHNYGSIFWTCIKILMLQSLSTDEIKRAMSTKEAFISKLMHLKKDNPITDALYKNALINLEGQWINLSNYWLNEILPFEHLLDEVRPKLGKIEIIHGDIRDLGTDFDLVYISNALGHTPYDAENKGYNEGKKALREGVAAIMGNSSYVLGTGDEPDGCVRVEVEVEQTAHQGWTYHLHRKVVGKPVATERFRYIIKEPTRYIYKKSYDPYYSGDQGFVYAVTPRFSKEVPRLSPGDRR